VILAGANVAEATDEWIGFEDVECLTFNRLLGEHRPEKLDLLQIGAGGYDFDRYCPPVIQHEGLHLSKCDELDCANLLHRQRYHIFCAGLSRVAVQKDILDRLESLEARTN
jgi:hypothetical protein